MEKKNSVEVVINGKQIRLNGFENEEYMQKVAAFINSKYAELKNSDSYRLLDSEMKNLSLQLNLADEYFRLKKQMEETSGNSDAKSGEIFDLKHEVIALQTKLEETERKLEAVNKEYIEAQKQIIRLETELRGYHE